MARINTISRPEITIAHYLKPLGFKKAKQNSLPEIGNYELDLYCADVNGHKVAIEYDGRLPHQRKEAIKNDLIKNKLCKEAGITLYRLREDGTPLFVNDGNTVYIHIKRSQGIKGLFKVASDLVETINKTFGTQFSINYDDKDKDEISKETEIIFNGLRQNRVGETRIATCGQKMTITRYCSKNDVDVIFEDGTEVRHKSYCSFQRGHIDNPNIYKAMVIDETNNITYYFHYITEAHEFLNAHLKVKVSCDSFRNYLKCGEKKYEGSQTDNGHYYILKAA